MDIEQLYTSHYNQTLAAAKVILMKDEDAKDICGDMWSDLLSDTLVPPAGVIMGEWLLVEAATRARKARNKRMKREKTHVHYTETPLNKGYSEPGVITRAQLEKVVDSKSTLPDDNSKDVFALDSMKLIMSDLPLADQEFLKLYEDKKAKDLVPRYGASVIAVRQRAFKLRRCLKSALKEMTK